MSHSPNENRPVLARPLVLRNEALLAHEPITITPNAYETEL
jgi:hypothetical protein